MSYLSPVAQALLNQKVGDEVEFEINGASHRHRIEEIHAYQTPPVAPQPAAAPAEGVNQSSPAQTT